MALHPILPPSDGCLESRVLNRVSALVKRPVECAGRWYGIHCRRIHRSSRSISTRQSGNSEDLPEDISPDSVEDDEGAAPVPEGFDLRALDPKDWKEQDHYAVLALAHRRYRATDDEIKKAYKQMVLKHHPDKRGATGHSREEEDAVFTVIKKAYDVLANPVQRRAYDSIDPEFDDSVPAANSHSKAHFYEVFAPVFKRNARWSRKTSVPLLGDEDSTFEDVDNFYSFWYDFDSWRVFSYFDKEDTEKAESREERRWMEKQNKAERQQKKREETARLRSLVDHAYACDARIRRFKEEEKQQKESRRLAKAAAAKAAAEERDRKQREQAEAQRIAREKEEEERKIQIETARKERERQKKAMQKERKAFRAACQEHKYFSGDGADRVQQMENMERLCEALTIVQLEALRGRISCEDSDAAKAAFQEALKGLLEEQKRQEQAAAEAAEAAVASAKQRDAAADQAGNKQNWSHSELQLLVKAIKLNPAGTVNRWEVIASFINQHSERSITRTSKDVIAMAKKLQKDTSLKEEVNKKAFERFDKDHGRLHAETEPTKRFDQVGGASASAATGQKVDQKADRPWTADEQKLLETALKQIPGSAADRWDQISAAVGTRSKLECKKRCKELMERVKAKKSAAAASKT